MSQAHGLCLVVATRDESRNGDMAPGNQRASQNATVDQPRFATPTIHADQGATSIPPLVQILLGVVLAKCELFAHPSAFVGSSKCSPSSGLLQDHRNFVGAPPGASISTRRIRVYRAKIAPFKGWINGPPVNSELATWFKE